MVGALSWGEFVFMVRSRGIKISRHLSRQLRGEEVKVVKNLPKNKHELQN
jgi:hypothetical protein